MGRMLPGKFGWNADIDLSQRRSDLLKMASRRLRFIKLGLAITVGAFLVVILVLKVMPDADSKSVQATVTAIRPADDAYHMMVWVTAQAPTGAVSSTIVPLQSLRCKVGDTVDGELRGTTLSLREWTCRRS